MRRLLALALLALFAAPSLAAEKMNVLLVASDDLTAAALGCYGNKVCKSPNIDRLAAKGVRPDEYDITMGGPRRAEMIDRSGGRMTVPQVFIDGRHIGGSDDLAALDARGGLDPLLGS